MAGITDTKPNIFNDLRQLALLKAVLVGIIEPEIAKYAAVHELDTGWMRDTIDANLDKYAKRLADALDRAANGSNPESVIKEVSKEIVADLKRAVAERGLVKTGAMRNAIEAVD